MNRTGFNIHLAGVGGQGIGLLSEIILRAADHAGHRVKSVDTHGLAQRGGIVVSQIRIGEDIHSPLISAGQADLVIALERHEALRALGTMLKDYGLLVYYDTVWQPLSVRLDQAAEVTPDDIRVECRKRGIRVEVVFQDNLPDARMQNMVVLAAVQNQRMIPGIDADHYEQAMQDLLTGPMLQQNMAIVHHSR